MTTTKNDDGDTGDGNKYSNGQAVIVVNRLFVIFIPSAFHEADRSLPCRPKSKNGSRWGAINTYVSFGD